MLARTALAAPTLELHSGPAPVPLLELFSSEGCSSCLPAEAWLARLQDDPALWREFVPIAWHVNYWDRLGWPDRFAKAAYTERQYAYARAWDSRRVYTPAVVRGGTEWNWRRDRPSDGEAAAQPGGDLVARVTDDAVAVSFTSAQQVSREVEVHVALLGTGIVSDVRRGENRGRHLEHGFVVLDWTRHRLRDGTATVPLPQAPADVATTRTAIAVWVSEAGQPAPLQATGGWWPSDER